MTEGGSSINDDDETHPIPHLTKIDVAIEVENGGYYSIISAKPLKNDVVTRERLLRKLDSYVNDFYSEGFKARNGAPLPGKLRIEVRLHSESEPAIVEFLESCRPWLEDNHIDLRIVRSIKSGLS